jgi:hypothetical protein
LRTTHGILAHWPSLRSSELCDPEIWTPLRESGASRIIEARSQASARVFTQLGGREVVLESYLERKMQSILAARPDVMSIEEQPEPVAFIDAGGKRRHHVFDFRVAVKSGTRFAVAVKAKARVTDRFRNDLSCIARQIDTSYAKGVVLITEEVAPRLAVQDALILNSVKNDTDYEAYAALLKVVQAQPGPIKIRDLGGALGRKTSGFRAVVRLIVAGFLVRVTNAPLSPDAFVRAATLVGTAPEAWQ